MPTLSFYLVTFTALISILFFKKLKETVYSFFIYYVIFVFFIELLGFLFAKVYNMNTDPIYNTYVIVTPIFYFLFYKSLFKKENNKKVMNFFLIIYFLFTLYDMLILKSNFMNDFFVNNMVFGSILIVIMLILFLIEIISNEEIIFNIKKSLIFWISIGALLFYIGSTPIIIGSNYLKFEGLFDTILTVLNLIMYGSFVIGFIYSDKKYNY